MADLRRNGGTTVPMTASSRSERPTRVTAGTVLRLLRTGAARSRADLVALTGAPRSTVSSRVAQLLAARLVLEGGSGDSRGGRPPTLLAFNRGAGQILAVDLGA